MPRTLDLLTSPTLKHLRDQWWNDAFALFLEETLRPKAGKRILDVGCGPGTAERSLARLRISQVELFGMDVSVERAAEARRAALGMNARVGYSAADACHLPFRSATFDSTFCVAVLQHIRDIGPALSEISRVTKPGGRVLVVEPDNAAPFWFSSLESGNRAFDASRRFFAALAAARDESGATAVGPRVPGVLDSVGVQPVSVHVFPVSISHLGRRPAAAWDARRSAVTEAVGSAPDSPELQRLGADYAAAMEAYARDAAGAGQSFVEIQNTLLFATVGLRADA